MIPSVLAQQMRQGVEDFLRTTFPISTPFFHDMLDRLLAEDGGVFKGPYLQIQLPFRQGVSGPDFFPDVPLAFKPYVHQEQAFRRLSGPRPRSTIVATGTGSGKTESFLYPILDYCYRHRGEPGIKALIIYPMNALAYDQAGRLARIIWNNPKLKGNVTAGLFVGQSEREPRMVMGPDDIITNKDTQRLTPPDILLTNYKMLDYLLIRPKDYPLWKNNGSETLQFLVVDELHTFDGAQGTDLACLVRRLKARLTTPKNFLCCVGTSATLGSDTEQNTLRAYATKVFGEPFDEDAVLTESRLSAGEFLENRLISRVEVIAPEKVHALKPESYDASRAYLRAQHALWFGETIPEEQFDSATWRVALGERLQEHLFFQNLLKALGGKVQKYADVLSKLEKVTPELRGADSTYHESLLNSLLALVSAARVWAPESVEEQTRHEAEGKERPTAPFLHVRLQYWLRDLRRMVGEVRAHPRLRFADDLNETQLKQHLPIVHCRECGSMGWAGLRRLHDNAVGTDLQSFYIGFFSDDPKVTFLFPEDQDIQEQGLDGQVHFLCVSCLRLASQTHVTPCPSCGHDALIRVFAPHNQVRRRDRQVSTNDCPYCGAPHSLTVVGSRAASLTSILIAQLYASSFNDDKKLLTFSDSVQDAAHRAGFFAARTYHFNLRSALQQVVQTAEREPTLAELPETFASYWSSQLDDPTYIATFLAPNMLWFRDYEHLRQHGHLPEGSRLRWLVDQRIGWEIFSEYGFTARIGRSLEKSNASVAHPDPERLDSVVQRLLELLCNELGELRLLDELTVRRFLTGLLVHLKNHGAILHPVLGSYIEQQGKTFLITQRHIPWMPNFGPHTRAPVFVTTRPGARFDQLLNPSTNRRTWYQAWAEKCFTPVHLFASAITDRLYAFALKVLVEEKILEERRVRGEPVWGICPEALRISCEVSQFRCQQCSHNVSVAAAERSSWQGAPCLRFHCPGHYEEQGAGLDYYGKLYTAGDVQRIFAAEHTGLLEREAREELERRFKARAADRQPWDPNLLSCTPTLEMGIDIGDLSSVLLCSVPPAQANYLQRIGRAGRRDGNALNLTVANARPHDLYFFAAPEEMIAGRVDVPGVFLDASAVLERQFTAFCFDRWVESGIPEAALPRRLGQVLSNLTPLDERKFPYNLLRFSEAYQTELFDRFVAMFEPALTPESIAHLRTFVAGDREQQGSLQYRIVDGLYSQYREQDSLRKKVRLLRDRIRRKEEEPARDQNFERDVGDLKREREALQRIVSDINDRETFNFFTDEGLIPNYAFPEAGVMLRSIIYRTREEVQDGGGDYNTRIYSYERPAVSAIAELAPANHFYAGGRVVQVDQVDMAVSEVETWQFCNNCSHMELVGKDEGKSSCPRCGSMLWSDAGQKRQMLRMRQVFATTSDRKSLIGDDTDDREPNFYNTEMLVDFEDRDITDAYRVDSEELPFGFEFLRKATFREINFGEKGEHGEHVMIAGVELPRQGFTVCRLCGKVQHHTGKPQHTLSCTARDQTADKNFTDCIYLYRELTSEAIRMLLPVTTFAGSDRKLHSFIAALHLGLKRRFSGNIDHLQTTPYEEPVPDSTYRKKYLVLYDTVPGGTGYLQQLMRSEQPLLEVFAHALDVLRSCPCNNEPDKDGCYRCLYAYRRSYFMPETSRDTAIELLSEILQHREHLQQTDTLRNVPINALFDSELEARFIEALRRMRSEDQPVSLSKELVNGKPGYFFRIGERVYYIEPQVQLGPEDGVSIPAKADFVFHPARAQDGGKPVAVFTDGYLYHRNRVGQDMAQRMAIVQSGRYYVWSLTWKDVENRYRAQENFFKNYLDPSRAVNGNNLGALLDGYGLGHFRDAHRGDSFEWLMRFLRTPDEQQWQGYAFVQGLIQLNPPRFATTQAKDEWLTRIREILPEDIAVLFEDQKESSLYGLYEPPGEAQSFDLRIGIAIAQNAVHAGDGGGLRLACCLYDSTKARQSEEFEVVWNGFVRLYNLFQFLPLAFCVTQEGLQKRAYDSLRIKEKVTGATKVREAKFDTWAEVRTVTGTALHDLLDRLAHAGWPAPEAGYELANDTGEIVATAELAWPALKVAFLQENECVYAAAFEKAGWLSHSLDEVLAAPETYLSLPQKQEGQIA
ncbi:MAG: DEAD/DEAH box helicase [Deltaproteobacteria bacterium]|nr:DEAD/DEAH box helicase [Deltaproteobacteria bacterium]